MELMSNRRFHVYIEQDKESGVFAARCLEMSVFSQGRTEEDALRNIKVAISLHLDTLEDELKGKKLVEVELESRNFPEKSLGRNCCRSSRNWVSK